MSLQVTGKNIKVGESFQSYVGDKLDDAIDKYLGSYLAAHVRVEKLRGRFISSCSVRMRTGLMLESTGEGTDAYSSADAAFEHMEKRMRRYKRRLKNRHHGAIHDTQEAPATQAGDFVVSVADDEHDLAESMGASGRKGNGQDNPVVVAETERTIHELPVSEAVMRLDLTDDAFLVFRNGSNGEINVVYRRADGNIGWIDPATPAGISAGKGRRQAVRAKTDAVTVTQSGVTELGKPGGRQSQSKRLKTSA
ncbi:MAG: ribosome-associated translation inhibitor RaiA [Devosia sp.]